MPRRRSRPDTRGLPGGERALAWADVAVEAPRTGEPSATGAYWIGTAAALYPAPGVRVPWMQVEQADWDEGTQRLRVRELAPFGELGSVHSARLLGADRLLQLVRERVTAALVHSQDVPRRAGGSFRVLARRPPDLGGDLVWSVELPPGIDPADPRVTREAAAALAAVRIQLGLDGGSS